MWTKAKPMALVFLMTVLFPGFPTGVAGQRPEGETANNLPEGKGRELVATVCVQCHSLSTVTTQKKNKEDWDQTVSRMIANGAQASPDEVKTIVAYLAENFGLESKPPAAAPGSAEGAGGGNRDASGGMPDGPGKEVVSSKCFQCHASSMWRDIRQDKKKWEATLYRMVGKGALWTEDEIAAMAQYLGTAFGPRTGDSTQKKQK